MVTIFSNPGGTFRHTGNSINKILAAMSRETYARWLLFFTFEPQNFNFFQLFL
jgi:hypothetical protein